MRGGGEAVAAVAVAVVVAVAAEAVRGAPTGEGPVPPWDLKNTMFSGFHPLNYVICFFEVCFLKLFAMWED